MERFINSVLDLLCMILVTSKRKCPAECCMYKAEAKERLSIYRELSAAYS